MKKSNKIHTLKMIRPNILNKSELQIQQLKQKLRYVSIVIGVCEIIIGNVAMVMFTHRFEHLRNLCIYGIIFSQNGGR